MNQLSLIEATSRPPLRPLVSATVVNQQFSPIDVTMVYVSEKLGVVTALMTAEMGQMRGQIAVHMTHVDLMSLHVETGIVFHHTINVTTIATALTARMKKDVVQLLHQDHAGRI